MGKVIDGHYSGGQRSDFLMGTIPKLTMACMATIRTKT